MIRSIKRKFVIVTMLLLTVVFSVIFIANTLYDHYWYKQDAISLLESLSENSIFRNQKLWSEKDKYYAEIYTAFFDENGQIVNVKSYGESTKSTETINEIAGRIYAENEENGDIDSYIYVAKDENGGRFIAFADMHSKKKSIIQIMGTILLVAAAFVLFLVVSFYLSRFVTEPAQRALDREKQFISDASHELKTPISAIIVNAQAMTTDAENSRYLNNILSEAERMNQLVRRLLTLAYADESDQSLRKEIFSLSESCEEIILSFESIAFESRIDFSYDIEENIYYSGSRDEIKQVLSILLDNAFKYTCPNGLVKVTLKKHSLHPVLKVYNTGNGILPEDLPHIFERFYCCSENRSSGSFGLGLSIAQSIMKAHNGQIKAESVYGEHTEFTVIF